MEAPKTVVTFGQLMPSIPGLNVLKSAKLPLKASLHIGRLLRKAQPEVEEFKARFNKIIQDYGKPMLQKEDDPGGKFKKGDPITLEDGSPMIGIAPDDPNFEEVQKLLDALHNEPADIGEYIPLNPDLLGDEFVLTPEEMIPLSWVFAEN